MHLIIPILLCSVALSQEENKPRDIIYLKNEDVISTQIVRVGASKIHYYDPETLEIVNVRLKNVKDYEFNNYYFYTNAEGRMEHCRIVNLSGYNLDEIYRAVTEWFTINSSIYFNGIHFEDYENNIIIGHLNTDKYFKLDFWSFMSLIDDKEYEFRTYSISFYIKVRIKDERLKIYLSDFDISNNETSEIKTLKDIYGKRKTVLGIKTESGSEISNLIKGLNIQIAEIGDRCEIIRNRDIYYEWIVSEMLVDDDW